ncbi:unnamed protein product [Rotaria sordida]|uniref:BSD domain-containing protein n=1 Tax=Rotaria sordida TaxID=392033 RepID=A0A815FBW9_9BILA|nr:unnamed protein product [Rotaria sordida]CAF4020595.1 unnamed protein product [Rotaria sordida]
MASWFTSAIQSVRDKSIDALDFVRRDLTEFTTTVKSDTESYLNKIKSQDVGDLGINRFVSKLSGDAGKMDNDNGKHLQATPSLDRIHNELTRLQNDESTYLIDPIPNEAYEIWRQTTNFNVDTRKGDIAQLLIDAPHVRSFYARLVPAHTTHNDFWSRYYYRLHLIEEEEARRTQLLRRAHEICSENNDNIGINNENDWDEPDDDWSKEPSSTIQESISEMLPVEQQESIAIAPNLEETQTQRNEISGDSWEREFDETDLNSPSIQLKSLEDPLTKSEETITSESLSSSTIITTAAPLPSSSSSLSSNRKAGNEFDDEWESWS